MTTRSAARSVAAPTENVSGGKTSAVNVSHAVQTHDTPIGYANAPSADPTSSLAIQAVGLNGQNSSHGVEQATVAAAGGGMAHSLSHNLGMTFTTPTDSVQNHANEKYPEDQDQTLRMVNAAGSSAVPAAHEATDASTNRVASPIAGLEQNYPSLGVKRDRPSNLATIEGNPGPASVAYQQTHLTVNGDSSVPIHATHATDAMHTMQYEQRSGVRLDQPIPGAASSKSAQQQFIRIQQGPCGLHEVSSTPETMSTVTFGENSVSNNLVTSSVRMGVGVVGLSDNRHRALSHSANVSGQQSPQVGVTTPANAYSDMTAGPFGLAASTRVSASNTPTVNSAVHEASGRSSSPRLISMPPGRSTISSRLGVTTPPASPGRSSKPTIGHQPDDVSEQGLSNGSLETSNAAAGGHALHPPSVALNQTGSTTPARSVSVTPSLVAMTGGHLPPIPANVLDPSGTSSASPTTVLSSSFHKPDGPGTPRLQSKPQATTSGVAVTHSPAIVAISSIAAPTGSGHAPIAAAAAAREASALSSTREREYVGAQVAAIARLDIERAKAIHDQLSRAAATLAAGSTPANDVSGSASGVLKGKTPLTGSAGLPFSAATTRSPLLAALSGGDPAVAATLIGQPLAISISAPGGLSGPSSVASSTKAAVRTLGSNCTSAMSASNAEVGVLGSGFLVRRQAAQTQKTAMDIMSEGPQQASDTMHSTNPSNSEGAAVVPLQTHPAGSAASSSSSSSSAADLIDPFPLPFDQPQVPSQTDQASGDLEANVPPASSSTLAGEKLGELIQLAGLGETSDAAASYYKAATSPHLKALGASTAVTVIALREQSTATVRSVPFRDPVANPELQHTQAGLAIDPALAVALAIHDSPLFSAKAANEFAAAMAGAVKGSALTQNGTASSAAVSTVTSAANSPVVGAARSGLLGNRTLQLNAPPSRSSNSSSAMQQVLGSTSALIAPRPIHPQNPLIGVPTVAKHLGKAITPPDSAATSPSLRARTMPASHQSHGNLPLCDNPSHVPGLDGMAAPVVQVTEKKVDTEPPMKGGLKGGMMSRKQFLLQGLAGEVDDELEAVRREYHRLYVAKYGKPPSDAEQAAEAGFSIQHYRSLIAELTRSEPIENQDEPKAAHDDDDDAALLEDEELRELMTQIDAKEFLAHLHAIDSIHQRATNAEEHDDEGEDVDEDFDEAAFFEDEHNYYFPSESGTSDEFESDDGADDNVDDSSHETKSGEARDSNNRMSIFGKRHLRETTDESKHTRTKREWLSYERHLARLTETRSSRVGDEYQAVIPPLYAREPQEALATAGLPEERIPPEELERQAQGVKRSQDVDLWFASDSHEAAALEDLSRAAQLLPSDSEEDLQDQLSADIQEHVRRLASSKRMRK